MDKLNFLTPTSTIIIAVIVAVVILVIIFKQVSVKVGSFTLTQQQKNDDETRMRIYAQIRDYENWTGEIERILFNSVAATFPKLTKQEKTTYRLLCTIIRRGLEKQIILDLVANHISKKSDEELVKYAKSKASGYCNRIYNILAEYDKSLGGTRDLNAIKDNIPEHELEEIYMRIYKRAIDIAIIK